MTFFFCNQFFFNFVKYKDVTYCKNWNNILIIISILSMNYFAPLQLGQNVVNLNYSSCIVNYNFIIPNFNWED